MNSTNSDVIIIFIIKILLNFFFRDYFFLYDYLHTRFGVTDDMIAPFLEGLTISEAMKNNRLFITDLEIFEGIKCQEGYVVSFIHEYLNNF